MLIQTDPTLVSLHSTSIAILTLVSITYFYLRGIRTTTLIFYPGSTIIGHDKLEGEVVIKCPDADCYNLTLTYNATDAEIASLVDSSLSCRQSFQVAVLVLTFFSVQLLLFCSSSNVSFPNSSLLGAGSTVKVNDCDTLLGKIPAKSPVNAVLIYQTRAQFAMIMKPTCATATSTILRTEWTLDTSPTWSVDI